MWEEYPPQIFLEHLPDFACKTTHFREHSELMRWEHSVCITKLCYSHTTRGASEVAQQVKRLLQSLKTLTQV